MWEAFHRVNTNIVPPVKKIPLTAPACRVYRLGMDTQALKSEMETAAAELGVAVSTLGRMVGQGGQFYNRLASGKRVWPETAAQVRESIAALRAKRGEA